MHSLSNSARGGEKNYGENLGKMIVGYWCTKVCWASKYFCFDKSLRVAKRKIFYWSTSKFIFSETNRKILKA